MELIKLPCFIRSNAELIQLKFMTFTTLKITQTNYRKRSNLRLRALEEARFFQNERTTPAEIVCVI